MLVQLEAFAAAFYTWAPDPNALPIPYVIPKAIQPPPMTLAAPLSMFALPSPAPRAPKAVRAAVVANTNDTMRMTWLVMNAAASNGMPAPMQKENAEATQDWTAHQGNAKLVTGVRTHHILLCELSCNLFGECFGKTPALVDCSQLLQLMLTCCGTLGLHLLLLLNVGLCSRQRVLPATI